MNGTGRSGSCTHSSAGEPAGGAASIEPAVAEPRGRATVAVEVPAALDAPRGRPRPDRSSHSLAPIRNTRAGAAGSRGRPAADHLVEEAVHDRVQIDDRVVAEVDLAELAVRVHLVSPRPHQQSLAGPAGGGHRREVRRRPDLLVVIPAGDVQHRHVDLRDPMLVAERLPPVVERRDGGIPRATARSGSRRPRRGRRAAGARTPPSSRRPRCTALARPSVIRYQWTCIGPARRSGSRRTDRPG